MLRQSRGSFVFRAVLVCFACWACGCNKGSDQQTPAAADQPVPTTPREVALAFVKDVQAGDIAGAKELSVGDDTDYQVLTALGSAWKSMEGMLAAAKASQPEASSEFVADTRKELDLSADLDAEAKAGVEKIDGDTATLAADEKDQEPIILKKVGDRWKVDLTPTLKAKHMLGPNSVKELQEMQQQADKMTLEIKTGKVSLWRGQPTTSPSTSP